MKKASVLLHLSFLFLLTLTFTACSDDDKETPAGNMVAGTYNGWAKGVFKYMPTGMALSGENVQVTENTDGTVKVVYASTGTWGTSTVSNATVAKGANGYAVSGSGKAEISGHQGGAASSYDCTLAGTISEDKKTYSFVFTLPGVMGGMTITVSNGTAPAALLVANSYRGWTSASFMYSPNPITNDGETVTVTASEDAGTVDVAWTSTTWGTLKASGVTVADDGSNYTLSGKGTITMSMSAHSGAGKDYDCLISGTISADGKTYEMVFSLPAVMGGTTITFKNGSAPTTSTASARRAAQLFLTDFPAND